ncbi:MAG: hypothetical protein RLZZ361_759 [Cyanobacteriota bacterium]
MLGLPDLNIRNQVSSLLSAGTAQFLNQVIPGYTGISEYLRKTVFQKNLHKERPQTVLNTMDISGYNSAVNQIAYTVSGTYNPLKRVWYLLQSLFGYSYSARIQDSLKVITDGANKYDSYQFANRSLSLLVTQMKARISKIQGTLSWLGLSLNKKVMQDPAVQGFKNAINSWLQPFTELIHGGVKGFGFTKNDWQFLKDLRDGLAYGVFAPYVKDVVAQFDGVLKEAQSVWQAQFNAQERANYQAQRPLAQASSQMKSTQQAA